MATPGELAGRDKQKTNKKRVGEYASSLTYVLPLQFTVQPLLPEPRLGLWEIKWTYMHYELYDIKARKTKYQATTRNRNRRQKSSTTPSMPRDKTQTCPQPSPLQHAPQRSSPGASDPAATLLGRRARWRKLGPPITLPEIDRLDDVSAPVVLVREQNLQRSRVSIAVP